MKPRAIQEAGSYYEYNDVRINRLALSLLSVFKKPIPDVFRDEVMNPIGASSTWKWVPYTNAYVNIDGKRMASVSGGTRWGGGMWINSADMARFGLLWLRGGRWGDRQIVSSSYVKMATTARITVSFGGSTPSRGCGPDLRQTHSGPSVTAVTSFSSIRLTIWSSSGAGVPNRTRGSGKWSRLLLVNRDFGTVGAVYDRALFEESTK
jgi:CubicO group peptidase (beta-lactamase class C family)